MQKRNIRGIERVIHGMTRKLQAEKNGPSNKGVIALARLLGAYTRAASNPAPGRPPGMTDREYAEQYGSPSFYDELSETE